MQIENALQHRHTGHCETGVSSILLERAGFGLSEAMVLGVSSGLIFAHFPFIRINELPLTSYRMPPGHIYRGLARSLGVRWKQSRFRDAEQGMQALDAALAEGRAVGLQTSVYWLPYFPKAMRFHFNAHNLIVYGRDGDEYLISDPVFEQPQRCPAADLQRARFVRGALAPKGLMYWPESVPSSVDWAKVSSKAIRRSANIMLRAPFPWVGVRAIRGLAKRVEALPQRMDARRGRLYLGQVVRMQEEIGTGGGGFRFMYAAYLKEAAEKAGRADWAELSEAMTAVGDGWRQFALLAAKQVRSKDALETREAAAQLRQVGQLEAQLWRDLLRAA